MVRGWRAVQRLEELIDKDQHELTQRATNYIKQQVNKIASGKFQRELIG